MWSEIAALVVGLATIAVGANWFIGRDGRRLRDLRAHAELLDLLPADRPATEMLAQHVDDMVIQHVVAREYAEPRRILKIQQRAISVAFVFLVAAFVTLIWATEFDGPDWLRWAAFALTVPAFGLTLFGRRLARRTRALLDSLKEQPPPLVATYLQPPVDDGNPTAEPSA